MLFARFRCKICFTAHYSFEGLEAIRCFLCLWYSVLRSCSVSSSGSSSILYASNCSIRSLIWLSSSITLACVLSSFVKSGFVFSCLSSCYFSYSIPITIGVIASISRAFLRSGRGVSSSKSMAARMDNSQFRFLSSSISRWRSAWIVASSRSFRTSVCWSLWSFRFSESVLQYLASTSSQI